jgi:hypothetical protein
MITFKDRTFCDDADKCLNRSNCYRYFNEVLKQQAHKWMNNPPVSFASFKYTCERYKEDENLEL